MTKPDANPHRRQPAGPRHHPSAGKPRPAAAPRAAMDPDTEVKVCGANACLAIFKTRRDDIIRAYVAEGRLGEFKPLLGWCAATRRAYRAVPDAELERITQSTHHEGICLLVRRRAAADLDAWLRGLPRSPPPLCVLLLEDVANPHNLGAIVRVAAHFGVAGILLAGTRSAPPELSAAVHRTAEGGLEAVPVMAAPDPLAAVQALRRAGFAVFAASSHAAAPLYAAPLSPRTLLLLGAENDGLSAALTRAADRGLIIPGTGAVESLNVACAAAVLLGEFWRLHRSGLHLPAGR